MLHKMYKCCFIKLIDTYPVAKKNKQTNIEITILNPGGLIYLVNLFS